MGLPLIGIPADPQGVSLAHICLQSSARGTKLCTVLKIYIEAVNTHCPWKLTILFGWMNEECYTYFNWPQLKSI